MWKYFLFHCVILINWSLNFILKFKFIKARSIGDFIPLHYVCISSPQQVYTHIWWGELALLYWRLTQFKTWKSILFGNLYPLKMIKYSHKVVLINSITIAFIWGFDLTFWKSRHHDLKNISVLFQRAWNELIL